MERFRKESRALDALFDEEASVAAHRVAVEKQMTGESAESEIQVRSGCPSLPVYAFHAQATFGSVQSLEDGTGAGVFSC